MANYAETQKGYAATSYQKSTYSQQSKKKRVLFRGCSCGGNSPCRGTCRTLFVE